MQSSTNWPKSSLQSICLLTLKCGIRKLSVIPSLSAIRGYQGTKSRLGKNDKIGWFWRSINPNYSSIICIGAYKNALPKKHHVRYPPYQPKHIYPPTQSYQHMLMMVMLLMLLLSQKHVLVILIQVSLSNHVLSKAGMLGGVCRPNPQLIVPPLVKAGMGKPYRGHKQRRKPNWWKQWVTV